MPRIPSLLPLLPRPSCPASRALATAPSLPPPVRGMPYYGPTDSAARSRLLAAFAAAATSHGYAEVEPPLVECPTLYARGLGGASEVVAKELFLLTPASAGGSGRGEQGASRPAALRPEGTSGLLRALAATNTLPVEGGATPSRYFYRGPMFRHERPQAGRLRCFTQVGVESLGSAHPHEDADCIALAAAFVRGVVGTRATLRLNTLGSGASQAAYAAVLGRYLTGVRERLSPDSQARVERGAPLRVLDSKSPQDAEVVAGAPSMRDSLTPSDAARFSAVTSALAALGVEWVEDPRLVRGLDYYSHTVFEFVLSGGAGPASTLLGGGRYDSLGETLGIGPMPGIGWAAGLERLHAAAVAAAPRPTAVAVVPLLPPGDPSPIETACLRLAAVVRGAGFSVELLHGRRGEGGKPRPLGKLLSGVSDRGCAVALVVGPDELAAGSVVVKGMGGGRGGAQTVVRWEGGGAEVVEAVERAGAVRG